MFNSCKNVYVHAPAGNATGGVELLHQLVSFLRDNGKQAYIVFCGDKEHKVHPEYQKYSIAQIEETEIEDTSTNVEVYTDTTARFLFANKRSTRKLFWWLSVDFYYIVNQHRSSIWDMLKYDKKFAFYEFKHRCRRFLDSENLFKGSLSIRRLSNVVFAYQCEYIRHHLLKHNVKSLVPLFDYINTDHLGYKEKRNREKNVLYNPAKGFDYTRKLLELSPDINWIPLKGYTREQLVEIMRKSMVYIDFGNHPGKDRLPRECALNGCCIITGKRGAAGYCLDVPINEEYKFDEKKEDLNNIIEKIQYCLDNYEKVSEDFNNYRTVIMNEKEEFENQVRSLFL